MDYGELEWGCDSWPFEEAVRNLWRIPHAVMVAPPSRSALGNVTRKEKPRSRERLRTLRSCTTPHFTTGETEAAVTSERSHLSLFTRHGGQSWQGDKDYMGMVLPKSLQLNNTVMMPYTL